MEVSSIIMEIDEAHATALAALIKRDSAAYLAVFSDDLKYKQLNGKTIDKKRLTNHTESYFSRIVSCKEHYERQSSSFNDDVFTEKVAQKTTIGLRGFIFFTFKWNIQRVGVYKWRKESEKWRVIEVEVLEEKIRYGSK